MRAFADFCIRRDLDAGSWMDAEKDGSFVSEGTFGAEVGHRESSALCPIMVGLPGIPLCLEIHNSPHNFVFSSFSTTQQGNNRQHN